MTPSAEYVLVARKVQEWIKSNQQKKGQLL